MTRPLLPITPAIGAGGGRHAGLDGHQVRFPGPPLSIRLADMNGASIPKLDVIWTIIVPVSGMVAFWFCWKRCMGTRSVRGAIAPVTMTGPFTLTTCPGGEKGAFVNKPAEV